MDFFKLIEKRHSVRSFKEKAVEQEKLQKILKAVSTGPSAGDLKAYEITVVTSPEQRRALSEAALHQEFVAAAPLVLVFSATPAKNAAQYGQRGKQLYALQDATIACTYAMLAAVELGLAGVWVGAFDEEAAAKAVALEPGLKPIALLPLGYANE